MAAARYRLMPRPAPDLLSLVVPVYNEQEMLPILRRELTRFMDQAPFPVEAVLVNDGSSDGTTWLLAGWAETDTRVKILEFARNFGHQAAITAGLDVAAGDAVVILDADLQDPLEIVYDMVAEYRKGFDVVYGKRTARTGESAFKRVTAWAFYRLMRMLIHADLPADAGDFRLISRRTVQALTAMREMHRFLRGMVAWVGFPQTEVPYVRRPRAAGRTKYPLKRMLGLAWTASVSFSPVPLRISFLMGLVLFLLGITQAVSALVQMTLGIPLVRGWASLIIVNCLVGGGILMCIGVLGEYIGRIFEEVKGRPLYIVASSANLANPADSTAVQLHRLAEELNPVPVSAIDRK
jgi:glycosyltransferase involved in cell wall biosynthesis